MRSLTCAASAGSLRPASTCAIALSVQVQKSAQRSRGTPISSAITYVVNGADSAPTTSVTAPASIRSSRSRAIDRARSSSEEIIRGVNDRDTTLRSIVWSGGSERIRCLAPGACGPPASRARPSASRVPRREEKSVVSWPTRRTSSYFDRAQNCPAGHQKTGASARSRA